MKASELIDLYSRFFHGKDHIQITAAPLATAADASTLFISAGMQPLIPYLSGQPHPAGRRLVNLQPCLRTIDIEAVGDDSHLTFFEMLGNWSLGDYFKAESIAMSYEFLTKWLKIDPNRLWVTVFAGDDDSPADDESPQIWSSLGLPDERIIRLGREDNWWGPVGETGPCGPDTEIFFYLGSPSCGPNCRPGCGCGRFLEIWNNVFMAYYRTGDGRYEPLPQPSVDTGMGVERVTTVFQNKSSVFETELFQPIIETIKALADNESLSTVSIRIVADHLKASTFLLGQGVQPANKQQGYVLRRLIRRAIDHGRQLGIEQAFTPKIGEVVISIYADRYPYLVEQRQAILASLAQEEKSFNRTLQNGRRIFDQLVSQVTDQYLTVMPGHDVFHLFDTYGIPLELTREWAEAQGLTLDEDGYEAALAEHREISGSGAGKYAGGLVTRDQASIRLHTATHLLHQALRDVLGPHVAQKGSHITPERLRFDFSHPTAMSQAEIEAVEQRVNDQIEADLPVHLVEMSMQAAQETGAIGLFEEKYGDQVKVYSIGHYSREICGGPHVDRTGELGRFHIAREQSSGAGVRRIRATLED